MTTQVRNPELVNLLKADFQSRYEPNFAWKSLCSAFLALPGLRGFWPMSAFDSAGTSIDESGNVNHLIYNGNPQFGYANLVPYCDYDGVGDYHSITDAASGNDFDILGTESYVIAAQRGLTVGGWFNPDSVAVANAGLISKAAGGVIATSAYFLYLGGVGNTPAFSVCLGGAQFPIGSSITVVAGIPSFIVGRYTPSTEVSIWMNGVSTTLVAGIPASINNSAGDLMIGRLGGWNVDYSGKVSCCFVCAAALSDAQIGALFQQTRAAFGV